MSPTSYQKAKLPQRANDPALHRASFNLKRGRRAVIRHSVLPPVSGDRYPRLMQAIHPLLPDVETAPLAIVDRYGSITDRPGRWLTRPTLTTTWYPRAVLLPGSRHELAEIVRVLHSAGLPFVPRGCRHGPSGGAVAHDMVIATTRTERHPSARSRGPYRTGRARSRDGTDFPGRPASRPALPA